MNNKNKIILDLCGGTGSWAKPYKDAGKVIRFWESEINGELENVKKQILCIK